VINQKRGDLSSRKKKASSKGGAAKEKGEDEGSHYERGNEDQPRIDLKAVVTSEDDKPALSPINVQNRKFNEKRHSAVSNNLKSYQAGDKSPLQSNRQTIPSNK
jgi:hypothetical protein